MLSGEKLKETSLLPSDKGGELPRRVNITHFKIPISISSMTESMAAVRSLPAAGEEHPFGQPATELAW